MAQRRRPAVASGKKNSGGMWSVSSSTTLVIVTSPTFQRCVMPRRMAQERGSAPPIVRTATPDTLGRPRQRLEPGVADRPAAFVAACRRCRRRAWPAPARCRRAAPAAARARRPASSCSAATFVASPARACRTGSRRSPRAPRSARRARPGSPAPARRASRPRRRVRVAIASIVSHPVRRPVRRRRADGPIPGCGGRGSRSARPGMPVDLAVHLHDLVGPVGEQPDASAGRRRRRVRRPTPTGLQRCSSAQRTMRCPRRVAGEPADRDGPVEGVVQRLLRHHVAQHRRAAARSGRSARITP